MGPSAPRTPKRGLLRQWILLPDSRKMIVVALVSIAAFAAFRTAFFVSRPPTFAVSHVLSAGACAPQSSQVLV